MRGTIFGVFVLVVLGGVAFGATGLAYDDAAEIRSVENESHVLDAQDPVTLEAADEWTSMYHNETVRNATSGEVLTRGVNYTVDYEAGELLAEDASTDGEEVLVTYWYDRHDPTTSSVHRALDSTLGQVLGFLVLAASVGVLASWFGRL